MYSPVKSSNGIYETDKYMVRRHQGGNHRDDNFSPISYMATKTQMNIQEPPESLSQEQPEQRNLQEEHSQPLKKRKQAPKDGTSGANEIKMELKPRTKMGDGSQLRNVRKYELCDNQGRPVYDGGVVMQSPMPAF